MNENAKEGHNRMIVQGYQENENRLKAQLQTALSDLNTTEAALSIAEARIAEMHEDLDALSDQVKHWRHRTAHWMGEARKRV